MFQMNAMHHRVLFFGHDGGDLFALASPFEVSGHEIFGCAPEADVRQATRELVERGYLFVTAAFGDESPLELTDALAVLDDDSSWRFDPERTRYEIWKTDAGDELYRRTFAEFGGEERNRRWREFFGEDRV